MQGSSTDPAALERDTIVTVQVQLGRPAAAGPVSDAEVSRVCRHTIAVLASSPSVETLVVAGLGAGLERCFRALVVAARHLHRRVVYVSSTSDPVWQRMPELPRFLAVHQVEVRAVASRAALGQGSATLRALNGVGYGTADSGLVLILEPLPRCPLASHRRPGPLQEYGAALQSWCNPLSVSPFACRSSFTVRWDGRLFDCAFNQSLGLELRGPRRRPLSVLDLRSAEDVRRLPVSTASHCHGCAAGLRLSVGLSAGSPAA